VRPAEKLVEQAPVYVLTGACLCEELIARLEKARSVEDYLLLRNLAAGARAYIKRDAEIATQMAVLAARIETAVEDQLRAMRGHA